MSVSNGLQESRSGWKTPPAKPLNEAVWQAWKAKGRAQDLRGSEARLKAVKLVSIVGLFAAAGLWSYLTPYAVLLRFIVALGATVVMFYAFRGRHYALAAVFGAIVLLYNPVVPVFSFSGDWQRVVVFASATPFVVSLIWPNTRLAQND